MGKYYETNINTYTDCDNCVNEECLYLSSKCRCFNVIFDGGDIIGIRLLNENFKAEDIGDLIKDIK
ncbi:MAG: hypothetical protein ACRDDY_07855 [Clostridium sp.]|uniref:hypothetical protein n=1 Tax=Clostridium sp. TaxID=1506 RepID=UPI003EE68C1C